MHLNLRLVLQRLVAGELRLHALVDQVGDEVRFFLEHGVFPRRPCAFALLLHQLLEARLVHRQLVFRRHQVGQIERKAKRVIQLERLVAGKRDFLARFQIADNLLKQVDAAVERGGKALLFRVDRAHDFVAMLPQFRERAGHEPSSTGKSSFMNGFVRPIFRPYRDARRRSRRST